MALRSLICLFLSGRFTQVLLYAKKCIKCKFIVYLRDDILLSWTGPCDCVWVICVSSLFCDVILSSLAFLHRICCAKLLKSLSNEQKFMFKS